MSWLTEEEYAAIGKFAASFGALEHSLLVTAFKIDATSNLLVKIIQGTFGQRLDHLEKVAKSASKLDRQLVDFIKNAKDGLAARNHFAHGVWESKSGKLTCKFYKKGTTGESLWCGTKTDLLETAQSNIDNVNFLKEWTELNA